MLALSVVISCVPVLLHGIVCVKQFSSRCSLFVLEILVYNAIEYNTAACRHFFFSFLWVLKSKSLCSRFFAHTYTNKRAQKFENFAGNANDGDVMSSAMELHDHFILAIRVLSISVEGEF